MSPKPPTYIKVLVTELRSSFFAFGTVLFAIICSNHTPAKTGWALSKSKGHNSFTIMLYNAHTNKTMPDMK